MNAVFVSRPTRSILTLDPIFAERFDYAELVDLEDGSQAVEMHYVGTKGNVFIMNYERYQLSVTLGRMLSKAEYEKLRTVKEPVQDANTTLAGDHEKEDGSIVEATIEFGEPVVSATRAMLVEDDTEVELPEQKAMVLPMHKVPAIRNSWEKLQDGFYLVRTPSALKKACLDFSANDFDKCITPPEAYPALVYLSYQYGKNLVVAANCLSLDAFKDKILAFK